jgi:heterodisulfide reductase subunit C
MIFNGALIASLTIFLAGVIFKVSRWFRLSLTSSDQAYGPSRRLKAVISGLFGVIFSLRFLILAKAYVLEVLFQYKALRRSPLRWASHILLIYGFVLLILIHALDEYIAAPLFRGYYSTINPFLWLRNLFGVMVLAGAALAVVRRFIVRPTRVKTGGMDVYVLILMAVTIGSGFLLEAVKMTSVTEYDRMVEDYAYLDDDEQPALDSYWVEHFGLVTSRVSGPFSEDILEQGAELHEDNCASCHSPAKYALVGYSLAKAIGPLGSALDRANASAFLYWFHYLVCLAGLAYLPFSKMFHVLTAPLSILVGAVTDHRLAHPAALAVKRLMELDACTHCGACTTDCSVGVVYEKRRNADILPSEKLAELKRMVGSRNFGPQDRARLSEGLYMCTNCLRCTEVCPVGINLQEMWNALREDLLEADQAEPLVMTPFSFQRALRRDELGEDSYLRPRLRFEAELASDYHRDYPELTPLDKYRDEQIITLLKTSQSAGTYTLCYTCQTCSASCPIPPLYDHPKKELDLLPHQIIRAAALGLTDLAVRSRMLWACFGCYKCQEQCPQGVRVTDIFYALKNMVLNRAKDSHFEDKRS